MDSYSRKTRTHDLSIGEFNFQVNAQMQTISSGNAVLLTGATGFVGGQLLLRLLARDTRKIVCLIRANSQQAAKARGLNTLIALLGRPPETHEANRVEWVRADIEKKRLGFKQSTWQEIGRRINEIYHCAASVKFNLPLEDAHRINVEGVEHLASLARYVGQRFIRFHHVSTAYVAGRTKKRVKADFLPDDQAKNYRNTYEQTKARAERLLRNQNDFPTTIYRPSIVAGETHTGRTTNWNVLYVPMRQIVNGQLPFFRKGGKAILDTVGVDFVVDAITALAQRTDAMHQAYHLTADRQAFDIERYVTACNAAAKSVGAKHPTKTVSPIGWSLRTSAVTALRWAPSGFRNLRRLGLAATRSVKSFRPYLAYTSVDVEFDAEVEQSLLAAQSIRIPNPDIYLEKIVGYAITTNFGKYIHPEVINEIPDEYIETAELEPVPA